MSAWSPQPGLLLSPSRPADRLRAIRFSVRRFDRRSALWLTCLIFVLVAQGAAITQSYLLAAPLIGVLVIALATDIPIVPFVGWALLARLLVEGLSPANSNHTGSLNLTGFIAVLFIAVAAGLLLRRRQGVWPTAVATLWLCLWTAIAIKSHGESAETVREGVREASIIALAVIVYNSRGALSVPVVTRLIQLAGIISALLALYQFGTHTGEDVVGQIRSYGTFAHPNGAAMYFAIATMASLWRYIDYRRRRFDACCALLYAAGLITTFSLGGLASLLVMLTTYGALRPGSFRLKVGACAVAGLVLIAFVATPLGAERIEQESATSLASAQTRGTANTSLAWRFWKWQTLIPEWEKAPLFGQGLGTTTTAEGSSENVGAGQVPHNEYLRYLVETGVVGLAILLWAAALLIRRIQQRRRTPGTYNAATLGMAIVAGCLFNALGDNTFLYSTTSYAAALIVAAVLALSSGAVRFSTGTTT
ncbi:MAG TPA: O-antigen ligase family protein [Solirubrobacteraceae bacterium]|nr:O-antigen ligase family protein [Solirubrobacteraceae bacterium]